MSKLSRICLIRPFASTSNAAMTLQAMGVPPIVNRPCHSTITVRAVRDQRVHFDPHASSDRKLPHEFVDDRLRSTMRAIRTGDPNRILSEELGELLGLRVAP